MTNFKKIYIKFLPIFLFSICTFGIVYAQSFSLKGKVSDAATGKAISNASVFLSSTSYGTVSNTNGLFELTGINPGKYDLIVSSIGYETFVETISDKSNTENIVVTLKQKSDNLKEVVVKSSDPDGWNKWGLFFLDNFIGTSSLARHCTLKNSNAVKFHFSKTKNELTAFATEPLIIENNALGYIIKYDLEDFSYNYDTKYLLFEGYPLFQQMQDNERRQKKWANARKEAYQLSLMCFMRSLFRNKLTEAGYTLYPLKRIPNLERERLDAKEKAYYTLHSSGQSGPIVAYASTLTEDSLEHFNIIMHQPDPIEIIYHPIPSGDSIAYAVDSVTAALDFANYLIVRIPKITVPAEYANTMSIPHDHPVSSVLSLNNRAPVLITANGYFYKVYDLLIEGFWGWWEKVSTMLPYDYSPEATPAH